MAVIDEELVHDVAIVVPRGPLADEAARLLIESLRAHVHDELIVDLRAVEPLPESVTASLVALLLAGRDRPDECCVVARGPAPIAVARFASVGDALQARTLFQCGYGPGWTVA
jgi:anti-anti-sigma regulatory factor